MSPILSASVWSILSNMAMLFAHISSGEKPSVRIPVSSGLYAALTD